MARGTGLRRARPATDGRTQRVRARRQARLRALFPGLAREDEGDDAPGWLRWAFACVRSRAFCLAPERFAFVPFLDLVRPCSCEKRLYAGALERAAEAGAPRQANHAAEPAAAYREAGGAVELVARAPLAPGEQATISYSGARGCAPPAGFRMGRSTCGIPGRSPARGAALTGAGAARARFTNQRCMTQYGFVVEGNAADRLDLPRPGCAPGRSFGLGRSHKPGRQAVVPLAHRVVPLAHRRDAVWRPSRSARACDDAPMYGFALHFTQEGCLLKAACHAGAPAHELGRAAGRRRACRWRACSCCWATACSWMR